MPRMLLTSSQVSAAITIGIVVLCTLALFISGVVLQRQSIRNLNAVLHPTGGRKGPWEKLVQKAQFALDANDPTKLEYQIEELDSIINGDHDEVPSKGELDAAFELETPMATEPDWSRRAYVQMVSSIDDICNAIMGVTTLSVQGSKAKRLLIYPSAWDDVERTMEADTDADASAFALYNELDLITIAKREHMLETMTTNQLADVAGDLNVTNALLNQDFDKLLFMEPMGLIINATRLDEVFETKMDGELESMGPAATLLQPRQANLRNYEDLRVDGARTDIRGVVETVEELLGSKNLGNAYSQGQLLGDIGYLKLRLPAGQVEGIAEHEELRKRGDGNEIGMESGSLGELVMERYFMDQETVCGRPMPQVWSR